MLLDKLSSIESRYEELLNLLSQKEIIDNREKFQQFSKELSELEELVQTFRKFKEAEKHILEIEPMLSDIEMKELAIKEIEELKETQEKLKNHLEVLLLPKDPSDEKSIIMEIRAGTGGEEAALFAGELLRMYLRYAERSGWKTEIMSSSPTGLGGYKEVTFNIIGQGVYSRLKYEGGVHRVQRVPATESSGRIHTSTATVAVLAEADEVEVQI